MSSTSNLPSAHFPRLALIGSGKMGKEVERLARERGIQVAFTMDSKTPSIPASSTNAFDVAIHFASPASVVGHVEQCAASKKNIVVGTTGWNGDLEKVRSIVRSANIGIVYASNFSVGVNVFFRLVRLAGTLLNKFPDYDVAIHEIHHKDKIDRPSGTALQIAGLLLQEMGRKKEILSSPPEGKIKPEQLQLTSTRAGTVVGTHTVYFDSAADGLELVHTAKNRAGFALGALVAAEWVQGKKGMYTMEDVLSDTLS